ncbi:MAG: type IV toxin-antitoxin system AbiEi family antitoxin [Mangrovibacterium sp.]
MDKKNGIRYWVETLPKTGKNVFTLEEITQQFPMINAMNIRNTLHRLSKKGVIQSVWHGFYAIIPVDYGLKGIVPPTEYIDQLMRYLGKEYYVGLLNAAAFHGAAHQQPQEFTVVVNDKNLRGRIKKGVKINFITRFDLPTPYIKQLNTRNGYIRISSAELTAMDLIFYIKEIGGINRAATVLNELAEAIDLQNIKDDFLGYFSSAILQRLGYILEEVLGYKELAETLYQKAKKAKIKFRKYPLKVVSKETDLGDYDTNEKWKIIINEEIEIDE